jgi:hypothetical protein
MSVAFKAEIQAVPLSDIVFREDLYPRIKTSPETVQKYAEDLSVLPPIEVNQRYELIDGWHRWTAHKKAKAETIPIEITLTSGDTELLELAIERNATHGLQLSQDDKRDMARRIYHVTPERDRERKKTHLAEILSVSERTIREWLSRIDKDAKEARERRIFDLWMQCYTQQEIAERENYDQANVSRLIEEFMQIGNLAETHKAAAAHAIDFDIPLYNVWKQQEKTPGLTHHGNTEIRFVDNLLYLYTKPFDVVLDPFAGTGSTLDICRKRFRRCFVSDRLPVVEREHEIRKHDLTEGLPKPPQWKDVRLVYLDPPYWKQAEGRYSEDPSDLANMLLEDFTKALAGIITGFLKKLTSGYVAMVMCPSQWGAVDRQFTDHIADMLRLVKWPVDMRFSIPYESQQYHAVQVNWAKENRKCLVLSREIVVWKVG